MQPIYPLFRGLVGGAIFATATGCSHVTGPRRTETPPPVATTTPLATGVFGLDDASFGRVTMNTLVLYRAAGAPQRVAFSTSYQLCAPDCRCLPAAVEPAPPAVTPMKDRISK